MRTKLYIIVLIVFSLITLAACATATQFKSLDIGSDGKPKVLTGKLKKPKGHGPFPAVVLLHGSGGINASRDADWAKRLTDWGYVTLQVDSFGPRGVSVAEILKNSSKVPHDIRAKDAHGAKRYLTGLPFVDSDRIAVMEWSHGGGSTIFSVLSAYGDHPFKAAIAFYP
jgi:dienelactone hydrolase